MPSPSEYPPWLESLVSEFNSEWKAGRSPSLDQVLPAVPDRRKLALLPLIRIDLQYCLEAGQLVRVEDYSRRYPEILSDPDALLSLIETETQVKQKLDPQASYPEDPDKRFPVLANRLHPDVDPYPSRPSDRPLKPPTLQPKDALSRLPKRVGRYRVERILGEGTFGVVYLAQDDQLLRAVAIKVPKPERIRGPQDVEDYLTEARTVTSLTHPHIVPVFDVGNTTEHPFFLVSQYIKGQTLHQKIATHLPSLGESIALVDTLARTLHFAHKKGIVHRDIKPGNILLDETGKPYVADFGLALREQDVGKRKGIAGTPSYMSPEQARGEAHRVDGRSDLFSLGVVFYQMITGHLPFQSESFEDLLDLVIQAEFKPPRQWDETIPREIERICTRAMARRASDRYSSCNDFAEDLAEYLKESSLGEKSVLEMARPATPPPAGPPISTSVASPSTQPGSDSQPTLRIVPKGLRSFDAHDSDFFVDLLPGPRDRHGLPDSIRFWKQRIEEMDPDRTFSVGLIYGPSGCGKSSLVKAGLLPRLAKAILPVYFEATSEETETRLLKGLRKQCPLLPAELDLTEGLKVLQRGKYLPANQKILILIDQFEQWLHAHKEDTNPRLVEALRQCDGRHVQCIVMVRDDFWMAATRFLKSLEIRLLEGNNSASVDLFDCDHALKVIRAYGKAYGKLSDSGTEQKEFLQQAIAGLAEEGKVISVRLALFAEMMKAKPWTPASLKAVGGTAGVGFTFLEETFSARGAPPEHKYHQKAAQGVLQALLPESGTDIKGHMRSREDLLSASGYRQRPKDFADLLQILDGEIRLITPTDPEGTDPASGGRQPPDSVSPQNQRYYQLTHDYLVPSLRDWLTRKEKETPRGRARLLLVDQAAVWNARPETRQLPSLLQWLQIRRLTDAWAWTSSQKKMMRRASRYHGSRALLLILALASFSFVSYEVWGLTRATAIHDGLVTAEITQIPDLTNKASFYRRWLNPQLAKTFATTENPQEKLNVGLALLPVNDSPLDYVCERLFEGKPEQVGVIRHFLEPYGEQLKERLWTAVDGSSSQTRLAAAAALATIDPNNTRWDRQRAKLAEDLVKIYRIHFRDWLANLRPARQHLSEPLETIYRDSNREKQERSLATDFLADYTSDQVERLANLLLDANESQFGVIFARLHEMKEAAIPTFNRELDRKLTDQVEDPSNEVLAKRQANAAVALLRLNQPRRIWPMLQFRPDPRVRSYLLNRLSPMGADPQLIVERVLTESEVTIRRALLLALGDYPVETIDESKRVEIQSRLKDFFRNDPDAGVHGAAEWVLRKWKMEAVIREVVNDPKFRTGKPIDGRQWWINRHEMTFVVIPPGWEREKKGILGKSKEKSDYGYSIGTKEVSMMEYLKFIKQLPFDEAVKKDIKKYIPEEDSSAIFVSWHEAVAYCNWLSKEEGLEELYEKTGNDQMREKKDLENRSGYRLLTGEEWDNSNRGGTVTAYGFGQTDELLDRYGWYWKNGGGFVHGGGKLKPNEIGLFDMQGNVNEWCQDSNEASRRLLRGGGWFNQPEDCRSEYRTWLSPIYRYFHNGFRLALVSVPQK